MMETQEKVKNLLLVGFVFKLFSFITGSLNHFNNDRCIMPVKSDNGIRIIVTLLKNSNSTIFITKNFHCGAFCQSCHISNS